MKSFVLNNLLPVLTLVLCAVVVASAQPGPSGGGTPTVTPIDGGVSMLLASGVAYGTRKLRALRSKKA